MLIVPVVVFPPVTLFTCHVTDVFEAFVTVAVNCCVEEVTTAAVFGLTVTETPAVTVTVAVSDFVLSATEIAFTVTGFDAGTVAGAVYKPVALIVPTVEFPPVTLFTCDVTAVLEVFATVVVNCFVKPACTLAVFGLIVTETAVTTVTAAVSDFVLSATETAVTVTAPDGTVAGAV